MRSNRLGQIGLITKNTYLSDVLTLQVSQKTNLNSHLKFFCEKSEEDIDDVALRAWIVFWEGTPLIDSLMKKMNKFQSQSDKPAAYFFVTSPSESSIELESHWSFFNQSWCLSGPAVPKKFSSSCQKLLLLLKSKYKQQGIKRPQTWPDNNGFHAKNTDIWESQIDLKCNTLLSFFVNWCPTINVWCFTISISVFFSMKSKLSK